MNPYYEKDGITIYHGDCLDLLPKIDDKSIDLIILDPPYNIGKDKWDKIDNYLEFMESVFLQCQRVLKDNGSFYWFHNQMPTIAKLMLWLESTNFVFKQLIVWDKWHNEIKKGNNLQGAFYKIVNNPNLRNYPKMAEYILFYTFQDETGLTTVMLDTNNFSTLRQYFKDFQDDLKLTLPEINRKLGHRKAEHAFYWKTTQWDLPTKETYQELLNLPSNGFQRRSYESLRQEYESLRQEYESLRYTFNQFNNQTSIWQYRISNIDERKNHQTQKPIGLIENIILHSSNENDLVLDCFAGSGTTLVAAKKLNRRCIGIELEEKYCEIAAKRLEGYTKDDMEKEKLGITQGKLF